MTWQDALSTSTLAGHYHITRYRELCDETWPDHLAYREFVIRLADPTAQPAPEPPPTPPSPEDLALQAHLARHGCCS